MQGLADRAGIDGDLMVEWLSCTFVYMLRQAAGVMTLQMATVTPQLEVQLGVERDVPGKHVQHLSVMYKPAFVFAPTFKAATVVWRHDPLDNHDTASTP